MLLTLAWVVPEYFVFLDLGLGRASSKYVAEALGREDKEHVSRFAWTAVIVQMVIGCLGALALIGLAPFLTDHLLNVSPTVASEAKVMFALAALSIPVVLVSNSFIGFLAAGQRFDLVNGVSVSFNLLSLLLTFLGVLYFDWNLNDIVAALVVGRVLTLGVYYRLCTHVFSSFRRARFHPAELRRLLAFGGWITVFNAIVPILLYLDRFMIGASLTVTAVAYYSVPYEIVTRLWVIPTSLVATLFPAFSTLIGQGQPERLASLLARSMKWMLLTLGPAVIVTTALAKEILQGWIGSDFAQESALVLQILALGILINSMVHVQYAMIQALGRPNLTAKFHLLQLPLHSVVVWCWSADGGLPEQRLPNRFD
jgi:O-antigen/teichoic acid export membrane protein